MERIKDLCWGIKYDHLFKDVPLSELWVESDELDNNLKVKLWKGSIIFYHKHLKSFDWYWISNRQIFRIEIDEEWKFSSVSIATWCKDICYYYLSILKSQWVFWELLKSIWFSMWEIKNETDVNNFIENENRTIDDYLETTWALLETLDHEKKLFWNVWIDVFSPDTP